MATQKITCPNCHEEISIDDVLTHQIENRIKKKLEVENVKREQSIQEKQDALVVEKNKIESEKMELESKAQKLVNTKLANERVAMKTSLKAELQKEINLEKENLEDQLKEKDQRLQEANKKELELRKEKNDLEDQKKNFEIEKQRQLDEERKSIAEEAKKQSDEESKYQIAQLQKQVSDATKAKDELARKLEQGSQQSQGEVLELELEELLIKTFAYDEILPVPKGMSGADIIQKVRSRSGGECGQIIWELKKTKSWSEGWIQKLKNDQRTAKSDIAVIVSYALPEGVKGFAFRDGVWVCDISMVLALATSLRMNLESVSQQRQMSEGKDEKMEVLYQYLTGVEFKQRVEAIVESFSSMSDSLKKERMAYEKIWSEREKQIQTVVKNTVGMYGDLNGMVRLQKIEMLELSSSEEIKK